MRTSAVWHQQNNFKEATEISVQKIHQYDTPVLFPHKNTEKRRDTIFDEGTIK